MLDKNGIEIKVGDVVEIRGGFFNASNGRFVVRYAPGTPGWGGSYCSLTRLNKNGTLSKAKGRTRSWPVTDYVSDRGLRETAREHNAKFATIEVVGRI